MDLSTSSSYSPSEWGGQDEVELVNLFRQQKDDAKLYFEQCIKPRLDRSYKLYIADNSDRAKEIKQWQANVFVPYIHAVVETLKPRILDARPEFSVQGRTEDDQVKAPRIQSLCDYNWEISKGDVVAEDITSSALIYGMGFLVTYWKKDTRTLEFLKSKKIGEDVKLKWEKETKTFYDAPYMEWVDNYSVWYDWHNTNPESKQYWFRRLLLSEGEIKRRYPDADKKRLKLVFKLTGGDLTDYASIRNSVKTTHSSTTKGADWSSSGANGITGDSKQNSNVKLYEVFEWERPFDDKYAVMVNGMPILKGAVIPNVYDFKETRFIGIPYLKIPGEYEGYGLPMILENPQIMLNMLKNQRLDAMTLNIHKMWIVNPLANINKDELVARPFGIIYSPDPNGAREVQTSDIKQSAYREEELLKSDMRYSSGVDDFSMGAGGGSASATEVRHLRESTLERVRLFVNHLGEGYSIIMRRFLSMYRQFYTKDFVIRITGDNGELEFPLIQADDLMGEFDFKATVIPGLAGQNDVKKKQDMDLFQLLIGLPFIDPEKLTSKMLYDWNWNIESLKKGEQPQIPGEGQIPGAEGEGQIPGGSIEELLGGASSGIKIPDDVLNEALSMIQDTSGGQFSEEGGSKSPISEASTPIDLLKGGNPPTVKGVAGGGPGYTNNPRGFNRKLGGKVNTNISENGHSNIESQIQNRALNIQR